MDEKILAALSQLLDDKLKPIIEEQKIINEKLDKLDRIEKKLDAVVEQTADLTEFRTEMKDFRNEVNVKLSDIIG